MRRNDPIWRDFDWLTVILFLTLALMGWANIYSSDFDPTAPTSMFDFGTMAGKQFFWICVSSVIGIALLIIDFKFYQQAAYVFFGFSILLLLLVKVPGIGVSVMGQQNWIRLGPFTLQPSELAKLGVALAAAKYLDTAQPRYGLNKPTYALMGIILLPIALIITEDTGSGLVFFSLIIMVYLDGLSFLLPLTGIIAGTLAVLALRFDALYLSIIVVVIAAIVIVLQRKKSLKAMTPALLISLASLGVIHGTSFFVKTILKPHHRERIEAIFDPWDKKYRHGVGYNTVQSQTAIGSGGFDGKGYLNGNFTKGGHVPEQHTDFIFSTIGEEHGFIGSSMVILTYIALLLRLLFLSGRQRSRFARIFAWSIVSIIFFHFFINVGMAIGLLPVIGIPLPFFSYGGSSMLAFSMMIFIFLKLDMHRTQVFARAGGL